jgi:methyl coenzyme M reductase subunit D
MPIQKIFIDETSNGNKLRAYVNHENRCYITVGELDSDTDVYTGYITLDLDDLTELISELQHIKNLIDKSEENG